MLMIHNASGRISVGQMKQMVSHVSSVFTDGKLELSGKETIPTVKHGERHRYITETVQVKMKPEDNQGVLEKTYCAVSETVSQSQVMALPPG